jgi:hypothetical protein
MICGKERHCKRRFGASPRIAASGNPLAGTTRSRGRGAADLNALVDTDVYNITLGVGKNALKMPLCSSTSQRLTGRIRHKHKNSLLETAPFL